MKPLLIQFTGTQNTGKSTLVDTFLKKYRGEKIGEISRVMHGRNIVSDIDINASLLDQIILNSELMYQYYDKINNAEENSLIIAERSPFCCLGYFDNLSCDIASEMKEYVHDYLNRFIYSTLNSNKITLVTIYIPIDENIKFEEDGIRRKDSQYKVDLTIRKYVLGKFIYDTIRVHKISSVDLKARIKQLEDIVEYYKPGLLQKLKVGEE